MFKAEGRTAGVARRLPVFILAVAAIAASAPSSAGATGTSAWGYNAYGELGDGGTSRSTVPVAVTGLGSGVKAVSAGVTHALALMGNGTVMAWGANEYGQLGSGSASGPETCSFFEPCSTKALAVSGLSGVSAISGGGAHTLALLSDGTVKAWGANGSGQLGDGTSSGPATCGRSPFQQACSTSPVAVSGISTAIAVAAGARHSLALLSDHTVVAWGNNEYGQLGDESTESSDVPVAVKGLSGVIAIAAGYDHSLALLSSGAVMAWGDGESGQLGNGTKGNSEVPVAVSGLSSGAKAISGGGFHSLALLGDGTVRAWGLNGNGQLGNGTVTSSTVPVTVTGLSGVVAVAAGQAHNLALSSEGTLSSWGWNNEGQLGNGTIGEAQPTAAAVPGQSGVSSLSAGGYYSLAYSPPPPSVSAVAPNQGLAAGGTTVTITGTELTAASAVKFGSTDATSFTVDSDTSITAVSPPGTGTVDVTVTTPGGTSATGSADQFTYVHSAVEGLPEFGRCVPSAPKKGEYKFTHCVADAAGKGTHNWLPGAGPNNKFKSTLKAPALETTGAGKTLITCAAGKAEGRYSGVKSVRITTLVFSGCAISPSSGVASECQNIGAANGEIQATELSGELGFIATGKKPKVGLDLKAASGSVMASFECGGASEVTGKGSGTGTPRELEGSVIGKVGILNTMTTANATRFRASGGQQLPESFKGGVKDTLTTLVGLTKTATPTTLVELEEVTSEAAIEVRDKLCKAGVCVS